jgi:hypothetical protein
MKTATTRGVGRYLYALTEAAQGRGPESGQAAAAGRVLCAETLNKLRVLNNLLAQKWPPMVSDSALYAELKL